MMKNLLLFFLLLTGNIFIAQQTIKGVVVDKESKFPLPGVNVVVNSIDPVKGSVTDNNGVFKITNVPIGRQSVQVSFIGYSAQNLTIVVNSAKEVILNIELEESAEVLDAVEIVAGESHEVNNEMAIVSSRVFSVEETERYAGSRGDPARMASNFAGVGGSDDSRNDIVVRGNSPLGVVYRVEGIDIPNPSHFAISGSTGGPTSMLNNKLLANSDFFTGAFPAEYGNSTAGIFDLKLRSGNNEKREFTAQFGVLGAEFMAEGPFKKGKRASYLFMYKYATLELFQKAGIDVGTNAIPLYQDMSFKVNLPFKDGGNLALWGIGGKSKIDILISNQKDTSEIDLYGQNDRDQYFKTGMGVAGATYTKPINESTFFKTTFSGSIEQQYSEHEYIIRHIDTEGNFVLDTTYNYHRFNFLVSKYSNASFINKKYGKKNVLKAGYNVDFIVGNFTDSAIVDELVPGIYQKRWGSKEGFALVQPYIQWKHKFSDELVMTAGVHNQYFSLSNSLSIMEPRWGLKWSMSDKHSLSLGLGRHSQTMPTYSYFYILPGNDTPHNKGMDFMYSNHAVLGYSRKISDKLAGKVETYYQALDHIPVEKYASAYSIMNQGSGFSRMFPDTLVNAGTGYNYGMEFTLEKYYSNKWHMLLTGALYNSRYKGSDGVERNTSFNGKYVANILGGREFKFNDKTSLSIGSKVTFAGGKRYGLVDTVASNQLKELVYLNDQFNEFQFRDYFRADLKISYKHNAKKVTHEFSLDLVNLLGTQNILSLTYAPVPGDPNADRIRKNYQLGFLPIFYYKIDF